MGRSAPSTSRPRQVHLAALAGAFARLSNLRPPHAPTLQVRSNDVHAVRTFYGVEAARATIVTEIRSVFGVYGAAAVIKVAARVPGLGTTPRGGSAGGSWPLSVPSPPSAPIETVSFPGQESRSTSVTSGSSQTT